MASKKPAKKTSAKKAPAKKTAPASGKKTAAAKKSAAKKAPAKKAPAKKAPANAAPRKRAQATGPYAGNNTEAKQFTEAPAPAPVETTAEKIDIVVEKPSWRSRLVAVFKK